MPSAMLLSQAAALSASVNSSSPIAGGERSRILISGSDVCHAMFGHLSLGD
jgi:hypothetical protein